MNILMQIHMSLYPYLYNLVDYQYCTNNQNCQASLCQKFLHIYINFTIIRLSDNKFTTKNTEEYRIFI